MQEEVTSGASQARADYEARPWLKHYPDFISAELTPPFANGLDMLLATVQAHPDQAAMYYFDETISYGDLDRESTALAAALQRYGVERGDRVALYLQNIPRCARRGWRTDHEGARDCGWLLAEAGGDSVCYS